jgi:hypothetical protein
MIDLIEPVEKQLLYRIHNASADPQSVTAPLTNQLAQIAPNHARNFHDAPVEHEQLSYSGPGVEVNERGVQWTHHR